MFAWLMNLIIASMIFFPDKTLQEFPPDYGLAYENILIRVTDKVRIHGWWLGAENEKGVVLFLHGNAGNRSGRLFKASGWVRRGYSVFLIDYRGYAESTGKIRHENDLYADSEAAFRYLVREKGIDPSRLILYGESIGSAPAVYLAAQHAVKTVILEAPFTSLMDICRVHYPMVPPSWVANFAFDNLRRISEVKTPVFILHGTADGTCPFSMGRKIFEAAPGRKEFLEVPEGQHNDLPNRLGEDYWNKPVAFLES